MKATKVTKTETYSDSQGQHIVCRGNLNLLGTLPPGNILSFDTIRKYLKPIIISETEKVKIGDQFLFEDKIHTLANMERSSEYLGCYTEHGWVYEANIKNKILCLSENLSSKHIRAILDKKIIEEEMFIECEVRTDFTDSVDAGEGPAYKVKLTNSYVKLFSIKKQNETYTREQMIAAFEAGENHGIRPTGFPNEKQWIKETL